MKGRRVYGVFVLFVLFVLVSSSYVFGVSVNNYNSLEVDTTVSIPINFVKTQARTKFDYLRINYSWLPSEDYRQKTVSVTTNPSSEIFENYTYLEVYEPRNFVYDVNFRTITKSDYIEVDKKVDFPLTDLSPDLVYYTRETELIDVNDDIRSLASDIAGNEDDLYVVVFKLADWVNTNIEYNLSTVTSQASLPSSWVLENRRGVCDEMSNLFVSMVRSLGIPAKTVTGIAYTDSDKFEVPWGAHGWTEVYFPEYGWIPFDPTYNQMGYIDASHIKLDHGLESERFNARYFWKSTGYEVEPGKQMIASNIINKGNLIKDNLDISVEFLSDSVDFNSYNVVKAKIKNLNDYYYSTSVALAGMQGVSNVDEQIKDVLLKPGETVEKTWIVKLSGDFKENFYYEFPMLIYTQGNLNVSKTFKGESNARHVTLETAREYANVNTKEASFKLDISCTTDKKTVFVGEKFVIDCNIESDKKQNYLVCIDQEDCFVVEPKDYDNIKIEKAFDVVGFKTFSVSAKKLPLTERAFLSVNVIDPAMMSIEKVENQSGLTYSDVVNINFVLKKKSRSIPKNVEVKLEHDYFDQVWDLDKVSFEQPFSFSVPVSNLKNGDNEFKILATYEDEKGNNYTIKKNIMISVDEPNFGNRLLLWFNEVSDWFNDLFG